MVSQRVGRSQRLAWLEGIRLLAVAMLLLYYAQLRFTGYAYTPQPTGLQENLRQIAVASYNLSEQTGLPQILSLPAWFGFQFIDVFILISGFSLVLSQQDKPLAVGSFLKHRMGRLLWPFWTVAWLAYPVLWAIAVATDSYLPKPWYIFASISFPLVYDYNGDLLMSTSGSWWLMALLISLSLLFPFLWWLLHRWGATNLLIVSILLTVGYRALSIYVFGGHPAYAIWESSAGSQPFALFLAKLSTFVLGMAVAVSYLEGEGPIYWNWLRSLTVGIVLYVLGFIFQFYHWGWVLADLLIPAGLVLCGMVVFRLMARNHSIALSFVKIGTHSYSYFLLYGLVVDRILQLIVRGEPTRYFLALPVMLGGTLILAMIADHAMPLVRRIALGLVRDVDYVLAAAPVLEPRGWEPQIGDEVFYQDEPGWTVLKIEKLWDEQEFFLCQISDGRRSLWVNEDDLESAERCLR